MFGHLTPASIQPLLAALTVGGNGRKDDRGLTRITQYLVQLSLGDGSAGTPMPPPIPANPLSPPSTTPLLLPKPVDRYTPEILSAAWKDLTNNRLPFTTRQAALRALSALTHASLTSKPDDPTYVGGLFVVLQTLLEQIESQRAEASRQGNRSLASFLANGGAAAAAAEGGKGGAGVGAATGGMSGGKKSSTLALYRARMETWGMLRLAFSAARVALSRSGIARIATKCFMGGCRCMHMNLCKIVWVGDHIQG